jgi:hypothetical protein
MRDLKEAQYELEQQAKDLIGQKIVQVWYAELEYKLANWDRLSELDTVDYYVELGLESDERVFLTWDSLFANYGISILKQSPLCEGAEFSNWNVSENSRWQNFLGKSITDAKLYWSNSYSLHLTAFGKLFGVSEFSLITSESSRLESMLKEQPDLLEKNPELIRYWRYPESLQISFEDGSSVCVSASEYIGNALIPMVDTITVIFGEDDIKRHKVGFYKGESVEPWIEIEKYWPAIGVWWK